MNLRDTLMDEALDLLDRFEFDKVATVMKFLNWKWYDAEDAAGEVPSIYTIRRTARKMILCGIDTVVGRHNPQEPIETWGSKTGGLSVMITVCNTGDREVADKRPWCKIDLAFVLHESYSDGVGFDAETITE